MILEGDVNLARVQTMIEAMYPYVHLALCPFDSAFYWGFFGINPCTDLSGAKFEESCGKEE